MPFLMDHIRPQLRGDDYRVRALLQFASEEAKHEAFEHATGRTLNTSERERYEEVQRQANRWTYLGSAMTHPSFLATLQNLRPEARERVEEMAPVFC